MIKNGSLVLVDERGKTNLHFRRKHNDAWEALWEAVAALVPAGAVDASTKGVSLTGEDRDEWHDKKMAEIEQKKAEPEN
jgi:hypothetical protein